MRVTNSVYTPDLARVLIQSDPKQDTCLQCPVQLPDPSDSPQLPPLHRLHQHGDSSLTEPVNNYKQNRS